MSASQAGTEVTIECLIYLWNYKYTKLLRSLIWFSIQFSTLWCEALVIVKESKLKQNSSAYLSKVTFIKYFQNTTPLTLCVVSWNLPTGLLKQEVLGSQNCIDPLPSYFFLSIPFQKHYKEFERDSIVQSLFGGLGLSK